MSDTKSKYVNASVYNSEKKTMVDSILPQTDFQWSKQPVLIENFK